MKSREIKKFRDSYVKYEKNCVFEGYKLAVLFDEKDDVKRIGGRWDANEQIWWMPENKLLNQLHDNGTLVRDELNDKKMIVGPYGDFKSNPNQMSVSSHEKFMLQSTNVGHFVVTWYENLDAVEFVGPYNSNNVATTWYTIEKAELRWNDLISEGYNRVEIS